MVTKHTGKNKETFWKSICMLLLTQKNKNTDAAIVLWLPKNLFSILLYKNQSNQTHFRPICHSYRNQLIDLHSKSCKFFLNSNSIVRDTAWLVLTILEEPRPTFLDTTYKFVLVKVNLI